MRQLTLHGRIVVLRPFNESDRPRLLEILAEPSVDRWWGASGPDAILHDLYEDDDTTAFGIEVDGNIVGNIQFGEETDADYRHASIDIYLDPSTHGRGYGADAV